MKRRFTSLTFLILILAVIISPATAQSSELFVVGMANISPNNDGGWTTAHIVAQYEALGENLECQVDGEWVPASQETIPSLHCRTDSIELIIVDQGIFDTESYVAVATNMIEFAGADAIVGTAENYCEGAEMLASEYPGVAFATINCPVSELPNNKTYFGKTFEAWATVGYAAGLIAIENGLPSEACGVMAYEENSQVQNTQKAFQKGFTDAVGKEAKFHVDYVNAWYDPERETAITLACPDDVQIYWVHIDDTTPAAVLFESRPDAFIFGYDSDWQAAFADSEYSEHANHILASVVWNWEVFYTPFLKAAIKGEIDTFPSLTWGGLDDGLVGIAGPSDLVSEEIWNRATEYKGKILSGEIEVFPGLSDEEIRFLK